MACPECQRLKLNFNEALNRLKAWADAAFGEDRSLDPEKLQELERRRLEFDLAKQALETHIREAHPI